MILGAAGILNRGTSCKWPEEEERRESGRSHLFDIWLRMAGVKLGERKRHLYEETWRQNGKHSKTGRDISGRERRIRLLQTKARKPLTEDRKPVVLALGFGRITNGDSGDAARSSLGAFLELIKKWGQRQLSQKTD